MAEVRVIVVEPFKGVRDGEIYPVDFQVGQTLVGDLAAVAIRDGLAEFEGNDADDGADPAIVELRRLKVAELKSLAADRGIDLGEATSKAAIIAVIHAAAPPAAPVSA